MEIIELGATGLRCPRLGFGCASLMGRTGRKDSLRALGAAWDQGVRFFDTARSYGYGESEALLGGFLRGRREQAVIATKFGILAAPQPAWKGVAKSVARTALKLVPSLHGLIQKGAAQQFEHNQFTIPVLQLSIEQSLAKLGVDCVDILFLHAAPASVLEQDDLLDAMARLVESGKVRVAGLSATPEVVALAVKQAPPQLKAMQFPCNVFDLSAATAFSSIGNPALALVANHPFGGAARVEQCRAVLRALAADPLLDADLRGKLAAQDASLLADVVLNSILIQTGIHVVIPAMTSVEHIRLNVGAVTHSRFTAGEIGQMRQALQKAQSAG